MDTFLLYFGKMIFTSAVMFGYYHLVLRNRTFHHYNRFYLLAAVVMSLILPLLKVDYFTLEVNNDIVMLINEVKLNTTTIASNNGGIVISAFFGLFALVSVFLIGRFLIGIFQIERFKKQFPREEMEGISFYQTDLDNAPF